MVGLKNALDKKSNEGIRGHDQETLLRETCGDSGMVRNESIKMKQFGTTDAIEHGLNPDEAMDSDEEDCEDDESSHGKIPSKQ